MTEKERMNTKISVLKTAKERKRGKLADVLELSALTCMFAKK